MDSRKIIFFVIIFTVTFGIPNDSKYTTYFTEHKTEYLNNICKMFDHFT